MVLSISRILPGRAVKYDAPRNCGLCKTVKLRLSVDGALLLMRAAVERGVARYYGKAVFINNCFYKVFKRMRCATGREAAAAECMADGGAYRTSYTGTDLP